MARNFVVTTISGSHVILEGLTRISREKSDSQPYEVRPAYYTLRVKCPQGKVLNVDSSKDLSDLLELAFDSMAIRSSSYLLDHATSEQEIHSLLGDGLTRNEPTEKQKKVTFTGGKLELDYTELYSEGKKVRRPRPQDMSPLFVRSLSVEQAKELMGVLMARLAESAGAPGTEA